MYHAALENSSDAWMRNALLSMRLCLVPVENFFSVRLRSDEGPSVLRER